jgi:LuxR family maltose regulon positive regulatory protein
MDFSDVRITLPRLHADLVQRPQLQARLAEALTHSKLVLLSAPAGYGKTVALVQALRKMPADHAVAWVSASDEDDLQRLLASLLAALDPFDLPWRVSPDALPAVALRKGGLGRAVDELAHGLAQAEVKHGVMAFDDVHDIADPRVFDFIERLLAALPANWTLAMTTRRDPPLPLARMMVAGELREFRQDELRFRREDVEELLHAAQLPSSTDRVDQLLERTQGWVVGLSLELLAQSTRRHDARAQRRTFDYLAQEVFERLPPPMQTFLLRCSVLPELNAKRCEHVSADARASHWLRELERLELFVTVLGGEGATLRLHDLFREFLEGLLMRQHFDELPQLLRRAAEGEPDVVRRVDYLLRAGAAEDAALAMFDAGSSMIQAGAGEQLIRLIERFPEPLRSGSPELNFVRGMFAWYRMQFDAVFAPMHKAMTDFECAGQPQKALLARAWSVRARVYEGQLSAAFDLWDRGPRIEMDVLTEAVWAEATYSRSVLCGPYHSTPADLWRLVNLSSQLDPDRWPMTYLNMPLAALGRWGIRAPMQALVTTLQSVASESWPQLAALRVQAWLALWQGDVEAARELCKAVTAEAKWLGDPPMVIVVNQLLTAFGHHVSGDYAQARTILLEVDAAAGGRDPQQRMHQRRMHYTFGNLLGGLATASGDWPTARQLLGEIDALSDKPEWPYARLQSAVLRAELALQDARAGEAVSALLPLLDHAMDWDCYGVNARLRVALSRAQLRTRAADAAWDALAPALRQAMEAGEPLGLLLCGPTALQELAEARWPGPVDAAELAYLRDCAARSQQLQRGQAQGAPSPSRAPDSSLSDRELQVIELLAQGHSNKLIARALGISPHTVKRHMARIFDKTGQTSRTQVAAWYRRLGLGS